MVVTAERGQVARAGSAAFAVGLGVVHVAPSGPPVASRCGAGGVPRPDQMTELTGGLVPVFFLRMVAGSADHLVQGLDAQDLDEVPEAGWFRRSGRPVPRPGRTTMRG